MPKTRYFLASELDFHIIKGWVNESKIDALSNSTNYKLFLFREDYGNCNFCRDGHGNEIIDNKNSPVIGLFLPYKRSNKFYTIGELHVYQTREQLKSQYPKINKAIKNFEKMLSSYEIIFSRNPRQKVDYFNYYLEGTNTQDIIYAFPNAFTLISNGEYFVDEDLSAVRYENWLKQLSLRGYIQRNEIDSYIEAPNLYFEF